MESCRIRDYMPLTYIFLSKKELFYVYQKIIQDSEIYPKEISSG